MSASKQIKVACKRECDNEYCSVKREAEQTLAEYGMGATFNEKGVTINRESMTASLENLLEETEGRITERNGYKQKVEYMEKEMQSNVHQYQDVECSKWLKCNLDSRKTTAIINMQEQMIEIRK